MTTKKHTIQQKTEYDEVLDVKKNKLRCGLDEIPIKIVKLNE